MSAIPPRPISDAVRARKIAAAFEAFSEAYDKYVEDMDHLISTADDGSLYRKARCLIVGLDDVAIFMRRAKHVVEWSVWPFTRT